ncbi:claspin-like [Xyrauchen texanus]|uniref:claspin-like n=1 Tax=Xyrauchen texanus TaxID=154827 RepID=UPI002241C01D|nr:claspin-like [Xyrauchen texanus]
MSSLVSERPVDILAERDSDSGMGSPMEEAVTVTNMVTEEQQDSDEEIAVSRKGRSRKALQDSDSDGEQEDVGMAKALLLSESSDEETKTIETEGIKKKRGNRISRISKDSDASEPEKDDVQVKQKEKKKREKSQRRKEKEKRNVALVKRLKEKNEDPLPLKALNDSGCLLGDPDLFDAQLEEDSEQLLDEESLDAIRSAVKKKAKHKPHVSEFSGDEEQENKPQRKERKAAKASKEALKQLHSESQRLVRESMVSLPYYMPEPKSIDQFFKRRPRPEGSAMALLKSAKYQACILKASAAPPPDQTKTSQHMPEQDTSPQTDFSVVCKNQSSTTSLPLTDTTISTNEGESQTYVNSTETQAEPEICTVEPKTVGEERDTLTEKEIKGVEFSDQAKQMVSAEQAQTGAEVSVQAGPPIINPEPEVLKPRKDKLTRLRELGLDPPPVAKLCADDGAFVQLEPPQENPALKALQERFMKHIQPAPRTKGERILKLNVVRKESTPSGQEELLSESIMITVNEGKEEPANAKPGEKLVLLKSRLQQAMAIRRKEERERRAALYRLDNEDCEEEEEEAEMTESEDEEGVDELLGGGDAEEEETEAAEEEEDDEVSLKTCPSPDFKSPSPTPAENDGTLMLFAGNSCSRTGDGLRRSGPAGHETNNKMEEDDTLSLAKDSSHNSSFELMSSMIPSYQPVSRAAGRGLSASAFRSPSPCFFRPSFLGSASKSSGKLSEPSLSLPVEDSQDLYAPSSPSESALPPAGDSQGRFSLEEDTHSQLLDADGFLNVGPRGAPSRSHKRQLILDSLDENAMDANMGELLGLCTGGFGSGQSQPGVSQVGAEDELLGLCSGAFSTQPGEPAVRPGGKNKTLEPEEQRAECHGSSDVDMDQLLALCSGKFTGNPSASSVRSVSSPVFEKPSKTNRKKDIMEEQQEEEEEEEEEGDCEFRLLSDIDSISEKEENDDESDAEEEENDNEEEEEEEREAVFGPRPGKKKIRLAEFVDSEAELSGSEVCSEDEDDDGIDEYEDEDIQEELPSDEELMDQVNKIHMKQVLDDDKRRLRLYQERYLADGDLHSDGPGRARRFRWKNIDDNFEFGGMGPDGDEEQEDEEVDQLELQRRKERLEREQWIREQIEAQAKKGKAVEDPEDEEKVGEEDSQFMKLAKKLTAKTLQKKDNPAVPLQEKAALNTNQFRKPLQPTVVKRGSLLSQPRAMLQKLANISDSNPLAPRNSRGFLFQTLSPERESPASEGHKKQIKKRGQMGSLAPAAKRPCLGNSLKAPGQPRSIFSYLEN